MKQYSFNVLPRTTGTDRIARLRETVAPYRTQVNEHPLYGSISSMENLHAFLESHVYAVWDFMSLLKSLQQVFTCVTIPWLPTRFPECRRLVNEIVLGEESDDFEGTHISHFELYRLAMQEAGANSAPVERFLNEIRDGSKVLPALVAAEVPYEAARFVETTFSVLHNSEPHVMAAAFTFGREDLIPEMFRSIVSDLNETSLGRLRTLTYYLERHIDVDGDAHGPMALRMVADLCRDDDRRWNEAAQAAIQALEARLTLWSGIYDRILAGHSKSVVSSRGVVTLGSSQERRETRLGVDTTL
jgi:hypothetical protein